MIVKKYYFTILFCALLISISSQTYTFLNATEVLKRSKGGKDILLGDKMEAGETIKFKEADSKAALIQNGKGIFLIQASAVSTSTSGLVKNNLKEFPKGMSNRTKPVQTLADLINCFGTKTLLVRQMSIYFGNFPFTLTDSNYFFVKIKSEGKEISKRLFHRSDTVYFLQKDLFANTATDSKPIETPVKLFYKVNNNIITITETTFISPSEEVLKKEAMLISDALSKVSESNKVSSFGNYLSEFYGRCDESDIKMLYKDLTKVEKK